MLHSMEWNVLLTFYVLEKMKKIERKIKRKEIAMKIPPFNKKSFRIYLSFCNHFIHFHSSPITVVVVFNFECVVPIIIIII